MKKVNMKLSPERRKEIDNWIVKETQKLQAEKLKREGDKNKALWRKGTKYEKQNEDPNA